MATVELTFGNACSQNMLLGNLWDVRVSQVVYGPLLRGAQRVAPSTRPLVTGVLERVCGAPTPGTGENAFCGSWGAWR